MESGMTKSAGRVRVGDGSRSRTYNKGSRLFTGEGGV